MFSRLKAQVVLYLLAAVLSALAAHPHFSPGLKFVGKMRAPYVSNIPHPMVTPLPVGENTKWIMLTFDGTDFYGWDQNGRPILDYGTHGKFYVMDGPTWDGYHEFPPR